MERILRLAALPGVFAPIFHLRADATFPRSAPTLASNTTQNVIRLPEIQADWEKEILQNQTEPTVRSYLETRQERALNPTIGRGSDGGQAATNARGIRLTNAEGKARTVSPVSSNFSILPSSPMNQSAQNKSLIGKRNNFSALEGQSSLSIGQSSFLGQTSQQKKARWDTFGIESKIFFRKDSSRNVNLGENTFDESPNGSILFSFNKDKTQPKYLDDNNTPYTSNDDQVKNLPLEKQILFFSFDRDFDRFSLDATTKNEKRSKRSGVFVIGNEDEWGFFTSATALIPYKIQIDPYIGGGWSTFQKSLSNRNGVLPSSFYSLPEKSKDQDFRLGLRMSRDFFGDFFGGLLVPTPFSITPYVLAEKEWLSRYSQFTQNFSSSSSFSQNRFEENFSRNLYSIGTQHTVSLNHLKLMSDWSVSLIHDHGKSAQTRNHVPRLGEKLIFWPKKKWSLVTEAHFEEKVATPFQKYGDGVLIQTNTSLPTERRLRASIGPQWKNRGENFRFQIFREETKRTPLLVGTSPASAKHFPIGGIWARGALARWSWGETYSSQNALVQENLFSGHLQAEIQEALLDSSIGWQKGQPAPGRPRFYSEAGFRYQLERMAYTSTGKFRSGEYRDLGGKIRLPSRFQMDLEWEWSAPFGLSATRNSSFLPAALRVGLADLFAKTAQSESLRVTGAAGDYVLDPELPERKIELSLRWNW